MIKLFVSEGPPLFLVLANLISSSSDCCPEGYLFSDIFGFGKLSPKCVTMV